MVTKILCERIHLELQYRADGGRWNSYSIAPVIDLPGYGVNAAYRKLKETSERYSSFGIIKPSAECRIVAVGYIQC